MSSPGSNDGKKSKENTPKDDGRGPGSTHPYDMPSVFPYDAHQPYTEAYHEYLRRERLAAQDPNRTPGRSFIRSKNKSLILSTISMLTHTLADPLPQPVRQEIQSYPGTTLNLSKDLKSLHADISCSSSAQRRRASSVPRRAREP